jgi:hypothetical protein
VCAAILSALGAIIAKAGAGLKPFVPQLQTTFLKCLPDPVEDVRIQVLLLVNLFLFGTYVISQVVSFAGS